MNTRRRILVRTALVVAPFALVACNLLLGIGEPLSFGPEDASAFEAQPSKDGLVGDEKGSDAAPDRAVVGVDAATDANTGMPCDPAFVGSNQAYGTPELIYQSDRGLARIAVDDNSLFFGVLDTSASADHGMLVRTDRDGKNESLVTSGIDVGPGIFIRNGTVYFAADDTRIGLVTGCGDASAACLIDYRDPDFGQLIPLGRPFAVAADGTIFVPIRDGRMKRLPPPLIDGTIPDPEQLIEIPDAALSALNKDPSQAPSAGTDGKFAYLGSGLGNTGLYAWDLSVPDAAPQRIVDPQPGGPDAAALGTVISACDAAFLVVHTPDAQDIWELNGTTASKFLSGQNHGPAALGIAVVGARFVYVAGFYGSSSARILTFDRNRTQGVGVLLVNGVLPVWFDRPVGDGGDGGIPQGTITGLALDKSYLYVVVNATPNSYGRVFRLPKR